VASLVLLTW